MQDIPQEDSTSDTDKLPEEQDIPLEEGIKEEEEQPTLLDYTLDRNKHLRELNHELTDQNRELRGENLDMLKEFRKLRGKYKNSSLLTKGLIVAGAGLLGWGAYSGYQAMPGDSFQEKAAFVMEEGIGGTAQFLAEETLDNVTDFFSGLWESAMADSLEVIENWDPAWDTKLDNACVGMECTGLPEEAIPRIEGMDYEVMDFTDQVRVLLVQPSINWEHTNLQFSSPQLSNSVELLFPMRYDSIISLGDIELLLDKTLLEPAMYCLPDNADDVLKCGVLPAGFHLSLTNYAHLTFENKIPLVDEGFGGMTVQTWVEYSTDTDYHISATLIPRGDDFNLSPKEWEAKAHNRYNAVRSTFFDGDQLKPNHTMEGFMRALYEEGISFEMPEEQGTEITYKPSIHIAYNGSGKTYITMPEEVHVRFRSKITNGINNMYLSLANKLPSWVQAPDIPALATVRDQVDLLDDGFRFWLNTWAYQHPGQKTPYFCVGDTCDVDNLLLADFGYPDYDLAPLVGEINGGVGQLIGDYAVHMESALPKAISISAISGSNGQTSLCPEERTCTLAAQHDPEVHLYVLEHLVDETLEALQANPGFTSDNSDGLPGARNTVTGVQYLIHTIP